MQSLTARSSEYMVMDGAGARVGMESLRIQSDASGWSITSRLETGSPYHLSADIDWRLGPGLQTRILMIHSTSMLGDEHDIELAVTGNGVLAHRRGPDGPSQLELGWGPLIEVDYLSAAFSEVTVRRLEMRGERDVLITSVSLDAESLEPAVLEKRYTRLAPGAWECEVPATGYRARLTMDAGGNLVEHEGLFRRLAS